ncbi:hypothetical protein WA026_000603 [Henosepilachna vigintioctopunctata]|uniref:Uncharacterized protein n=1 Tax=Henosepilachna vigintioctopunctata TaxID=420089 RepID=A0AAW1V6L6_9CUCU
MYSEDKTCTSNERTNKYGHKAIPRMPWMPEAGPEWETGPSKFVKRVRDGLRYPPLFADKSWTKCVPQKDTQQYFKPTETMGKLLFVTVFVLYFAYSLLFVFNTGCSSYVILTFI